MQQVEKLDRVVDASFRFHYEFQVEKYLKVFLWNPQNVLMRMHRRKKKITLAVHHEQDDQIAISAKLLDIMHESYGFSTDLTETINQ